MVYVLLSGKSERVAFRGIVFDEPSAETWQAASSSNWSLAANEEDGNILAKNPITMLKATEGEIE